MSSSTTLCLTVFRHAVLFVAAVAIAAGPTLGSQRPPAISGAKFDVVSIKLNKSGAIGGSGQTLPDGTQRFINRPIATIVAAAAPGPVDEVARERLPQWVLSERYDIIAKPAPDSHPTRQQRDEMMRNLLIERLKATGHIEEIDREGFALVLARSDGKLGPQLIKSTLDCAQPPNPNAPRPMSVADIKKSCATRIGMGSIESGGITMDTLAQSLRGQGEGIVTNRTGLEGYYAV